MNIIAVYPASLDPITNGHINVIERAAPLYDELIILVASDSRKTYIFNSDERVSMAKDCLSHLPNVVVKACIDRYAAEEAWSMGAQVIIRGLRNIKDLEDEQAIAEENRKICPNIETVWIACLPNLMHVSSTMVKSHVGILGWEKQVARSIPAIVVANLKKKFILSKARKHWASLMIELGNPKRSQEVFESLAASYSESHRSYHTLEHIVSMLDEFEHVRHLTKNPQAVLFGIWYHDENYEPKSDNHHVIASNEARSAYHARLSAEKLGLPADFITIISGEDDSFTGLISATTHSKLVIDPDAQILVDLDLAILGKSEEEFDAYEAGIHQEYDFVPESHFRAERAKILTSFLKRKSIYFTEFFRNKYESTAEKNLKRSIGRLLG